MDISPPIAPSFGLSVEDLTRYHRRACNYARYRLTFQGARHYDEGDSQKIEHFEPHRMLLELRAEVADAINYLVGLDLVIARWQRKIEDIES